MTGSNSPEPAAQYTAPRMPSVSFSGAVAVRVIFGVSGGRPSSIVLHAINLNAQQINQTLANTVGAAIKSSFTSSGWAARVTSGMSLTGVGLRDLNIPNQAEYIDAGAAVPGTGTGDMYAYSIALVVTLRTAMSGKSYRGRCYLPGLTETEVQSGGQPTTIANTSAAAFLNAIRANLLTSNLRQSILSLPRPADSTTNPPTPQWDGANTEVTTAVIRNTVQVGSQRRRLHRT